MLAARRAGYALLDEGTPNGILAGGLAGGGGGGGGGEQVTYVDITPTAPALPEQPVLTVPEPEPVPETPPEEPKPEVPPAETPPAEAPKPAATPAAGASGAGTGGGTGTGAGTGSGQGEGAGVGPGSGGGTGGGTGGGIGSGTGPGTGAGKMTPPVPEVLLLPPPRPPASVRGQVLAVRVFVGVNGEVRDVEFRSTGDRGYDSRLKKVAMDWRFRPARDPAGKPVAVQFDVTLGF